MQNGKSSENWNEFEVLFKNLNKVSYDFGYEVHPDAVTLDRYVHNALIRDDDPLFSSDEEFSCLLNGESGWTRTSISLHVVSCTDCKLSIKQLREEYQEQTESSVSWWGQLQESSEDAVRLPSFKRSALALGILTLVVVTTFSMFERSNEAVDSTSNETTSVSESTGILPDGASPGGGETSDNTNAPVARVTW